MTCCVCGCVWLAVCSVGSYPDADVPMAQLSLKSNLSPAEHLRLGAALAPLRAEGVLIVGSGALTHNFAEFGRPSVDRPAAWVRAFESWVDDTVKVTDIAERTRLLASIMTLAPNAKRAHTRTEHLIPLLVAAGAAVNPDGSAAVGKKIYEGAAMGAMSLASYLFE